MASPFHYFRKHQKVFMAVAAVLCMIIFVFASALTPGQAPTNSSGAKATDLVATWDGGSINRAELGQLTEARAITDRFLKMLYYASLESPDTPEPRDGIPIFTNIGQELKSEQLEQEAISAEWVSQLAKQNGISVSIDMVNEYLKQWSDGRVGSDSIRGIFARLGGNRDGRQMQSIVYGTLQKLLLAHYYLGSYSDMAQVSLPAQRWNDWQSLNDRVSVQAVGLRVEDYIDQVPEPSDAELKAYFNQYKERNPRLVDNLQNTQFDSPEPGFAIPHRVRLHYLRGSLVDWRTKLIDTVSDEEVKAYYEEHKDEEFVAEAKETSQDEEEVVEVEEVEVVEVEEAKESGDATAAEDSSEKAATEANDGADSAEAKEMKEEAENGEQSPVDEVPAEGDDKSSETPSEKVSATKDTTEKPADSPTPEETESSETESPAESEDAAEAKADETEANETKQTGEKQRSPFRLVAFQNEDKATEGKKAEDGDAKAEEAKAEEAKEEAPAEEAASAEKAESPSRDEETATSSVENTDASNDASSEDAEADADSSDDRYGPKKYEPLEKVEDAIRLKLANNKAAEELTRAMDGAYGDLSIAYNRYSGQLAAAEGEEEEEKTLPEPPESLVDLQPLAEKYGLIAEELDLLSRRELFEVATVARAREMQGQYRPVGIAEFEEVETYEPLLANENPTDETEGDWYLVVKTEDQPRRIPQFKEAREQVLEAWKRNEAAKLALARAKELSGEFAKSSSSFSDFFTKKEMKVETTDMFSRLTFGVAPNGREIIPRISQAPGIESAGPEMMDAIFSLEDDKTTAELNHDHSIAYILKIHRREMSKEEQRQVFLNEANNWQGVREMMQVNAAQFNNVLIQQLRDSVDFKIDDKWEADRAKRR